MDARMSDDGALIYRNSGNISLLDLISSAPGRILDCGCGAGDNARILSSCGWRVTGVTIDPTEREAAQTSCESVYLADLEEGLPPAVGKDFDAVLASHVLEHLARPEKLLHDVRHKLKPQGTLAVALPNIAHYSQRISHLRGGFTYTETGQLDRTHLRLYTYWTARELLETNGYRVTTIRAEGGLPWWKSRKFLPEKLIHRVDNLALSRRPNLLGFQTLLLGQPYDG